MTFSGHMRSWKRFLSPRYIAGKIREDGLRIAFHKVKRKISWITLPARENFWSVFDRIWYGVKKQTDVLYAFYDLENTGSNFVAATFIVNAEIERMRVGCKSVHFIVVPGLENVLSKRIAHFASKHNWYITSDYLQWTLRNVVIPMFWFLPSCQHVTVCASRGEAQRFKASLVKHMFPKGYSPRYPFKYIFVPKKNYKYYDWKNIRDSLPRGADFPTLQAKPQACEYVRDWIKSKAIERKVITITLRERTLLPIMNNKLEEWGAFVQSLDKRVFCPVILRDIEKVFEPLPSVFDGAIDFPEAMWNIELRFALYELSYLNMFVQCGASDLCKINRQSRSLTFNLTRGPFDENFYKIRCGLEPGDQIEELSSFHKLVWEEDSFEVIKHEFEDMCKKIDNFEYKNK